MVDVIIIGAGPAGLTAAIYLRRANKDVLLIDAKGFGGAIINTNRIENYPACPNISGFDLAQNMYQQAIDLGATIKTETVQEIKNGRIKMIITNKNIYKAKAIIIATGKDNRKLGFEEEYIGRGVSYCAMCDGAFYKDKVVAVVGGGNSALEDAIYLSDIVKKVYLIHRRDQFTADDKTIELLKKKDNIELVLNSNITRINGKDYLESITVVDNKKKSIELKVSGLFIAIGGIPNTVLFKDLVKLNNMGYIKGSKNCHTNKLGIFVAGDVREKEVRQLVTATSDGAIAAIEAIKFLNK